MTARRLLLICLLALLALPATAGATTAQPTLSYPAGAANTTISVLAPTDTTQSISITIDAEHFCFFGCNPQIYDITSGSGFNNSTNSKCTQDGSNTGLYHCGSNPPALSIVNGSPNGDSITSNCSFLFSDYSVPLTANAGAGDDSVTGSCSSDTLDGGPGNDTLDGNLLGDDTITGDDGNDTIKGGVGNSHLSGGAGRDLITGNNGNETIDGGDGGDRIDAGDGNDTITGGAGSDYIIPGPGKDTISGGDGHDTVSYEDRDGSAPVAISIDGKADSGLNGENDTINTDVENIVGSPGDDTITATDAPNEIDAGDGNDVINPGGGPDQVDAGAGNDTVNARDGAQDNIDCGPGTDKAVIDEFDTVANCESVDSSREKMSDVDNDGVPAPADCNDNDATIRPGVPDTPGDGIDQNCDGHDEPFTRVASTVLSSFTFNPSNKITKVNKLAASDVPDNTTIELRCTGKKCPFKGVKRTKTTKAKATLSALNLVKKFKFRPGQVLEVRILVTNEIGKVVDYKMGKKDVPTSKLLCLPPKATKPSKC